MSRQDSPERASLPAGHHARPLNPDDLHAVFDVYAADELANAGEPAIEIEDIAADWARPSFDIANDSIGILAGDRLVAAAEISHGGRRAEVAVHPDAHGRGLGTWLIAWTERLASERAAGETGQFVAAGSGSEALLRSQGFETRYTAWLLVLPDGQVVPDRPVPHGYTIRTATTPERQRAAYEVIEAAFGEWPHRDPQPFQDWAATTILRPGTRPWQLRVIETDEGRVVGVCFTILDSRDCGFVHQLAVDRAHRGQGLAQALLADAFTRCRSRGATRCELSTDSRTGALGLYLKLGMQVQQNWHHLVRPVSSATVGARR